MAGQTLSQGDQQLRMAQTVALVLDGPAVLASDRGLTRAEASCLGIGFCRPTLPILATLRSSSLSLTLTLTLIFADTATPHQQPETFFYQLNRILGKHCVPHGYCGDRSRWQRASPPRAAASWRS